MIIKLTFNKLILLSLIIFSTLVWIGNVGAQETDPNQVARKYGVTFPVSELGNCTDLASCKIFCEDPVNKDACIEFAKQKGFYKEDALSAQRSTILARAKQSLGCDSEESCKELCEQESNRDKCSQFARQNNIQGGHVENPASQQIIQKAKETLGCDSENSCRDVCSQEENRDKCSQFAKQVGLRGGEQRVGPGGCTSEATCKAFCSDPNNFQICSQFGGPQRGQPSPSGMPSGFKGPGGCDSESSCRAYCQEHPQECRNFGEKPKPETRPHTESKPTGTRPPTTQELGCKTPQECYDVCKANPAKCPGFNPSSPRPSGPNDTKPFNTNYSQTTPQSDPRGLTREQQEAECKAAGGTCSSTSSTYCGCQNANWGSSSGTSGSSNTTSGSSSTGGMSRAEQEALCKSTGGSCGSSDPNFCGCQMPSTPSYSQSTYQSSEPTPTPAVQGVTAQPTFFQWLIESFYNKLHL